MKIWNLTTLVTVCKKTDTNPLNFSWAYMLHLCTSTNIILKTSIPNLSQSRSTRL